MDYQRAASFQSQDPMRPKRITGHEGSLGSSPELDSFHGPSVKEGGQVLDFAVVRLHPAVNAQGDAARYQEISS